MISRIHAVIAEVTQASPTVIDLTIVRPDGKALPDFLPGQYATLSFPAHTRIKGARSFSIVSSPTDLSSLRFGIRVHGSYTTAMREIQPGDPVYVTGPFGQFTFDPGRDRSAVFVAGGIGVTPFLSMIKTATDMKWDNDLTLLYSVRSMEDAPYMHELNGWQQANPHLNVTYAVSDGAVPDSLDRIVSGRITADMLAQTLFGDPLGRSVFLCGPPPFMKAMTRHLVGLGLPKDFIRTERFGVGSQEFIERGTPIPKYVFATWGVAAVILFGVILRSEQKRRADAATIPTITTSTPVTTNDSQGTSSVNTAPTTQNQSPTIQNSNSSSSQQVTPTPTPTQTMPIQPRTRMS